MRGRTGEISDKIGQIWHALTVADQLGILLFGMIYIKIDLAISR